MKTTQLVTLGLLLAGTLMTGLQGCQKENEKIAPSGGSELQYGGLKASATGSIVSGSTVVNGTYRNGAALTAANTITLKVSVTAIGTYTISSSTVNGYSFSKTGSFTSTGTQSVTLAGTGTPAATGINPFVITFGTTASVPVVVVSGTPVTLTSCGTSYTYYEVANHKTQKVWLDRNLGASRVGISASDFQSYGSLYQWGRLSDDHQCITWASSYLGTPVNGTIGTKSSSNTPGHSLFITTLTSPWDWRVPQNNALWQGTTGINNPCPSGYRLPTNSEFTAEVATWTTKNTTGAYGSSLKWVLAGYRDFPDGAVYEAGSAGGYWSSTVNATKSMALWFSASEGYTVDDFRAAAYAVRCIKN